MRRGTGACGQFHTDAGLPLNCDVMHIRKCRRMVGVRTQAMLGSLAAFAGAIALCGCAARAAIPISVIEDRIVTVRQWGGTPADELTARKHTVTRITLHHQGVAFPRGSDPVQYLRNLQSWSRKTRNWPDIPYHYVVDLDGNIYQGRDLRFAGDTNTEYDPAGHALIEVLGNYEVAEPNHAQLDSIVGLMTLLAAKYAIRPESIRGHKDFSVETRCPGKNLYHYLENGYFRERVSKNLETGVASKRPGTS